MRRSKKLHMQLEQDFRWLERNLKRLNKRRQQHERLQEDIDDLQYDRETHLVEVTMLMQVLYPKVGGSPE